MNTNGLAKHYDTLTPEERFRLILAADSRGDRSEMKRLVSTADRITLSVSEHWYYIEAYDSFRLATFIDLMEDANQVNEAFFRECDFQCEYGRERNFGEDECQ